MCNIKSLVLLSLAALLAASCAYSISDSEIDLEPRIVNGKPAARGQFPFYALLKISFTSGREGLCGGSLITNQWVLTAAHCVTIRGETLNRIDVHLGALNATDLNEEGHVVVISKRVFPNPSFSPYLSQNDVALLKLEQPVQFTSFVQAVNLTSNANIAEGTRVVAMGFGRQTSSNPSKSSTLQFAELKFINSKECSSAYPWLLHRSDLICAKGANRESTCNGDSGGPLIALENGVPIVVGTTSFGHIDGCDVGRPSGFTNTFIYLPWVEQVLWSN